MSTLPSKSGLLPPQQESKPNAALHRLNQLLPLAERQAALPAPLIELHRAVLRAFINRGCPLTRAEIEQQWPDLALEPALARLAGDDLIVLAPDTQEIIGAYPLTGEDTPHKVRVNGHTLRAMCALDALSVSPLFGIPVEIESNCRVTDQPLLLHQDGATLPLTKPSAEIQVGIHWQPPQTCAAHSLCREMVFLVDAAAAETWQAVAPEQRDCFSLPNAIALGAAFFSPLLEEMG
ncbi:MAG TPA: organomercurial lyase [Anaerolineae bacterium]|nr:organomercurial lyase [Anaerolineae bacterium]HMR63702.1 organomercurial lyase [Anaerolineae bacterium]